MLIDGTKASLSSSINGSNKMLVPVHFTMRKITENVDDRSLFLKYGQGMLK
jgi:hypothetical protein